MLARLIVARGRVVPVGTLVDDLWTVPPEGAVSAVRTFVSALRRAIEVARPPQLLVTEGPGYALRVGPSAVDAWRFERVVVPGASLAALEEGLGWWRGPAYAEFAEEPWALAERSRLNELRLRAVEMRAALLAPDLAVPALDAHVTEHPWREEGWRLLALALYRAGRQGDALDVLRRARTLLRDRLGVDPGPALSGLERDILRQSPALDPASEVFASTAAAYERIVGVGTRARLESTVGLLRSLAVTGGSGLHAARDQRLATVTAAEQLGDPVLTARVIGAYDVPAIWTRSDDPVQAAAIVAAARRTLSAVDLAPVLRARLLATIALESRGTDLPSPAQEALTIARGLDDPGLLAFALNGMFMQSFSRTGMAPERDATGVELIALAARHGLVTYEVLGHLIRLQSLSALGDFDLAATHADAVDGLAAAHELPLVNVFTTWFHAMRSATPDAYRRAATTLDGAGMPGLSDGLLALALRGIGVDSPGYGPYEPWANPGRDIPDPPHDLLAEALWCLAARAAISRNDRPLMQRARAALLPAKGEIAGAASGMLTFGPVAAYLADLEAALF